MLRRLAILLDLLCVTACAYLLAAAANVALLPPPNVDASVAPAAASKGAVAPPPPRGAFNVVVTRNLFDVFVPLPPKPKQVALTDLPVAAMGSKLIGTIYSNDPAIRRAIIQQGNDQLILKTGEAVEGLPIKEILRRAVVLVRGGQEHLLLIEGGDAEVALKSTRSNTVSRKWFEKQLANLADLVKGIQIQKTTYGKRTGILIQQLAGDSVFKGLGLNVGDLLLEVNGRSLAEYQSPLEGMRLLDKADEVKIDLLRLDKVITLTYNVVE